MNRKSKIIAAFVAVVLILTFSVGNFVGLRKDIWEIINTPVNNPEYYTPKSYGDYQETLDLAKEITSDPFAKDSEIDDVAEALQCSIDALQKAADKEPLQKIIEVTSEIDPICYIPISWEPVAEALGAANIVMQDKNAVDEDVLTVTNKLDDAVSGLIPKPDKAELIDVYSRAACIDTRIYRPSTVSALSVSLLNAKAILDNENAVESDVNAAVSELTKAVSGLEHIPDKTELQFIIDTAADYSEEKYTTATYKVFQEALASALEIASDDDMTQNQVDSSIVSLNNAINGLSKSTKCIWRISPRLRRIETNHVGNSWSSGVFFNGQEVYGSFEVTAPEGAGITITGKAVENDKIPDVGTGRVYLVLKDGNVAEATFYVRENRGRYAGNCAVWVLEVSCEIIERV